MKSHKTVKILGVILALMLLFGILPVKSLAAGVSYYQTNKADVPIWSSASSKSTKIRTVSAQGTVLKVTGSTTNSAGNLWYQLSDGYWVFSGNVTSHSHSYTGGICTGNGCGYEWSYTTAYAWGTYVVTNTDGAAVWSRPYSKNSTRVTTAAYGSAHTVVAKTTNQEGNLWYKLSTGYWIYSGNVAQRFTVSYNANGGSGAPAEQNVVSGSYLTISSAKPTRTGYVFQGWSTSPSATSANYKAGTSYKFTSSATLYAVWKSCSHSYTGGICSSCGYEYPISTSAYSGTFVVTNTSGAKIWSRPYSNNSIHIRTDGYNGVLTVVGKTTNQEGNLWYKLSDGCWVFSGNVAQRLTVSYNANGGSGAPSSQTFLKGNKLTLSTGKPKRTGYAFQGWAVSSSASSASYKAGKAYQFTSNVTLYAVWKSCSHSYTGGICSTCSYEYPLNFSSYSGTFVVTNTSGCKVWSRPYSKNSTHLRTEKTNAVLTVTRKTTNQEGNVWYQLSDGNWIFSGNVTQRYTVSYNANGGSGAPDAQSFLSGKTLKLTTAQPKRVGYVFKGWAVSKTSSTVKYKSGASYSAKQSIVLYAVWKECSHGAYSGGYCDTCGKEYPLSVKSYSGTFVVTNSNGAKVWSRPYSKQSTKVRVEAYNTVLTVTAQTTNAENNVWYQLSDGNWVYSGNITRRYTVTYDANGGTGAPSSQTFLLGSKLEISSKKPTRTGYIFQGWATASNSSTVSYKAGSSYKLSSGKTLYAVWSTCKTHSYNSKGICKKCSLEKPYTVKELSLRVYAVTGVDGDTDYANTYSNPFTGYGNAMSVRKGDLIQVNGQTTIDSDKWYRLSNGNWIPASKVSLCGTYQDGAIVYSNSTAAERITTVASISQSRSSAINYLQNHVGTIQKQGTIPGLIKTVTRTRNGGSVTTCSGMVPQGMTFAGDYLLISAYCNCGKEHRSVIYVLDGSTRKYQTTLILDDICHVGGLAKQGSYIWVCDSGIEGAKEKYLRAYSYSDIADAISVGANYWSVDAAEVRKVDVTPSYICSANGYLYVGTFHKDTETAKIYFYSVSGTELTQKGYFTISGIKQIQGISIRDKYMVVTSSYGRYNKSKVYVFENASGFKASGVTYKTPKATYSFANMVEACYIGKNYTYFLFESGAKAYRTSPGTRPLDRYVAFSNETLTIT